MDDGDDASEPSSPRRFAPAWCGSRWSWPLRLIFLGGGQPPEMTARQWRVVSAVMAAGFFSHFDDDLLPLCLRQLQRTLGIPEPQVCLLLSVVATGKGGAAFMSVIADVLGRRAVFFCSICAFSLLSGLSAFQRSVWGFVALQLIARVFLAGKDSMANVYLVEETDPKCRGWVIGTCQSVAVTGGGCAVILFGAIGAMEDGWRYLYGLASLQLFFLAPVWRLLPGRSRGAGKETRGEELRRDALRRLSCWRRMTASLRSGLRPLRLLATAYPKRAAACLFVNANNGFAFTPSVVLKVKHLQDVHGLSPAAVSGVVIGSGLAALVVFPLLGRLSDKGGRRTLLCCFMTACPIGVLLFYNAPSWAYLPFYFLQMMGGFALNSLQTTFFAESFPESHRCTAQGVMMLFGVLGMSAGLAAESFVYLRVAGEDGSGSHAASVSLVLLPAFVSPIVVRCCLPETAGKDLNEIAPERHEGGKGDGLSSGDEEELIESSNGYLPGSPKGRGAITRKSSSIVQSV